MFGRRPLWSSLLLLALPGAASCDSETSGIEEDHGYILLRLSPAADTPDDWAAGTATFSINVQYGACLADFYEENPTWKANEVDGMPVFEAWNGMLCTLPVEGRADCTVESIFQEFSNISALLVRYTPTNVEALNGAVVPIGPLPTQAMAGCEPRVRFEPGAAIGVEHIGERVWEAMSFSSETAVVGQDEIVEAEVSVFY